MRADRFRHLLDHAGPFASIYFGDSHDTEDAAAQMNLRWRSILGQLEDQGVDAKVSTELERAVHAVRRTLRFLRETLVSTLFGAIVRAPLTRSTRLAGR
jgi:peptide chain release factor subunit 1